MVPDLHCSISFNIISIFHFQKNLETYLKLTLNRPKPSDIPSTKVPLNFAVIHVGAPCCGINAAVRSFVRNCILVTSPFSSSFFSVQVKDGVFFN
jgi:hypothetical protein